MDLLALSLVTLLVAGAEAEIPDRPPELAIYQTVVADGVRWTRLPQRLIKPLRKAGIESSDLPIVLPGQYRLDIRIYEESERTVLNWTLRFKDFTGRWLMMAEDWRIIEHPESTRSYQIARREIDHLGERLARTIPSHWRRYLGQQTDRWLRYLGRGVIASHEHLPRRSADYPRQVRRLGDSPGRGRALG